MIAPLPLEKMTIEEKISTMELLWDDICKNSDDFPSPAWHGDLFRAREEQVKNGEDTFEDWDDVKREIWDSVK